MKKLNKNEIKILKLIAEHFRRASFSIIKKAGSGHLGACSSSAELMTALYFSGILKFDIKDLENPNRDLILVRGHLGPLRYKIFSVLGLIKDEEISTYRQLNSRLKGHESMDCIAGIDITPSGSLGMILSYAVGAAIVAKNRGSESMIYVFLGDGEEQEGNIAEAARHATALSLNNIVCIMDRNGKQLSRATKDSDGNTKIIDLWKAYGFNVVEIDGHNIEEIHNALSEKKNKNKPTMIIANTIKGKGINDCEKHYSGYHTLSTCKKLIINKAILDSTNLDNLKIRNILKTTLKNHFIKPKEHIHRKTPKMIFDFQVDKNNNKNLDDSQLSFFRSLEKKIKNTKNPPNFYMFTADFIKADTVKLARLDKFMTYIDVGIREQHMIALAHGISTMDKNAKIFINYGDAFLYRASDQINVAVQGNSSFIILSEYAGLSQGQNGKTHQSVGQPFCLATIPGIKFYEPGDVKDLYNFLNLSLSSDGIKYIRIHKENVSKLPRVDKSRDYYRVLDFDNPDIVIVSNGMIIENTLKAAERLSKENNVKARVINLVNYHSVDSKFVNLNIVEAKPLFTFYNGHPDLIGNKISEAIFRNSNNKRPKYIKNFGYITGDTGKPKDLLKKFKLNVDGIIENILKNIN